MARISLGVSPAAMQSTITSPVATALSTNAPSSCRRHRRNSDVFAESRHLAHSFGSISSSSDHEDDEHDAHGAADSGAKDPTTAGHASESTGPNKGMRCSRTQITHDEVHKLHHRLPRNHTVSSHHTAHGYSGHFKRHAPPLLSAAAAAATVLGADNEHGVVSNAPGPVCHTSTAAAKAAAAFQETIMANTKEEPMSSEKALRIFDIVFSSSGNRSHSATLPERHDESCQKCVSEALVAAHQATKDGIAHGGHGELRMNLGNGRNGIYVAPCEKHIECPLEKKSKRYLIHTHKPKIMTDMSKVEFGICVDGWKRIVFKTVNDTALAKRELSFYQKTAAAQSDHIVCLLDEFTDNSGKQVLVFPRMNSVNTQARDLFDIACISRQLFLALSDLHSLGIAHMDITPTNLMCDPNDPSHVEVIDFGLACDITATENGRLPSRGTCGFVAPEVLSGEARDLRADIYSTGVVLGMMLQNYLPTISLRLLGGPLVRSDTTDMIIGQLDELLEAYKYTPDSAEFIECDAKFAEPAPAAAATTPTTPTATDGKPDNITDAPVRPNTALGCPSAASQPDSSLAVDTVAALSVSNIASCVDSYTKSSHKYSDEEDEAAAFAAAYCGGGSSLYGGYGYISDDDDYDYDSGRLASSNTFYSRNNYPAAHFFRHTEHSSGSSTITADTTSASSSAPHYARSAGVCEPDCSNATSFRDSHSSNNRYYRSPNNTPVYSRNSYSGKQHGKGSLVDILAAAPTTHSSSRYAPALSSSLPSSSARSQTAGAMNAIHLAASSQSSASTNSSGSSGKYGRVPAAVLHAADLLRWTLQFNPQCRPTAKQALDHPFLAPVEVKKRRHRSTSSPALSADTSTENGPAPHPHSPPFAPLASPRMRPRNVVFSQDDGLCLACANTSIVSPPGYSECACENSVSSGATSADDTTKDTSPAAPAAPAAPSSAASVPAGSSARDQGIFKGSAADNIHTWESEMHSKLAHSAHGDRMDAEGYSHSYNNRDEVSIFYTSSNNYNYNDDDDDSITSYFY